MRILRYSLSVVWVQLFVGDDGRISTVGKECMGTAGSPFTAHPKVDPMTGTPSSTLATMHLCCDI